MARGLFWARSHVTVLLAAAMVCMASRSCTQRPDGAAVKAELDKLVRREPDVVQPRRPGVRAVHIYIDVSRSVRGFVSRDAGAVGQTEFMGFLTNLRSWVMRDYANCPNRYFVFGDYTKEIADLNKAKDRSLYDFGQTDLVGVLRTIADAAVLPEAVLVVTDGVPVGPTQMHDWSQLVEHVSRWAQAGNFFQMMMMPSQFDDDVYSIQKGKVIGAFRGKRPFYCFVFSPKPDFGRSLAGDLKADGMTVDMLNITGRAIVGCLPSMTVQDRLEVAGNPKGEPNPVQFYDQDRKHKFWFYRWRRVTQTPGCATLVLDMNLDYECRDLSVTSSGLRASVTGLKVVGGNKKTRFEAADGGNVVLYSKDPGKQGTKPGQVQCMVEFRPPPTSDWYAYRLDVKTGYGTIQPPAWVAAVSTESDASLDDWKKTMNLDKFVKSILGQVKPLTTIYVAIGR